MSSLREQVAEGVFNLQLLLEADECEQIADAAIAAVVGALREPTRGMIDAGIAHAEQSDCYEMSKADWFVAHQWQAMLTAFLEEQANPPPAQ